MSRKRPYLITPTHYDGLSRTQFRRLPKAAKREAMIEWFAANYEDPVHRTPYESAEGGYQYIWGGPYDAREELDDMFGGSVPDELIDEVLDEVESDGTLEWTRSPQPDDYDEEEPSDEPVSLDIFLDVPSAQYGTAADHEARTGAKAALSELQKFIDEPRAVGIGHNQPPDDEEDEPEEVRKLRPAIAELSAELAKPNPIISLVKRWAIPLRNAVIASSKWGWKKVDTALDAGVKAAATAGAAGIAAHYSDTLRHAFEAVARWLEIAAQTLF